MSSGMKVTVARQGVVKKGVCTYPSFQEMIRDVLSDGFGSWAVERVTGITEAELDTRRSYVSTAVGRHVAATGMQRKDCWISVNKITFEGEDYIAYVCVDSVGITRMGVSALKSHFRKPHN